jgi:[ribosomal protein S5]-alanine N-acetyltransferase
MIAAERLTLRPLDPAELRAIADADRTGQQWHEEFPRQDDRDVARRSLMQYEAVFGSYAIVERGTGLVVGAIGFFGPPDAAGTVTIGYGLVPSARRLGYATEALRALVTFAFAQDAVRRLEADADRSNVASHRVLEKAGFIRTHSTDDAHWYAMER